MSAAKSKEQVAEERRAAIAAQRLAQKKAARRSRILAVGALAAAAVVLAAVVAFIFANAQGTKLGDVAQPSSANSAGAIVLGAGGLGEINDDAPTVEVYSDYLCSYCAQFEELNGQALTRLATDGSINLNYHLISILDSAATQNYSTRAGAAAAAVAERAPEQFAAFHGALLAAQPEDHRGLTDAEIRDVALSAGISKSIAGSLGDGAYTKFIGATTMAAFEAGITATPTIVIDGTTLDTAEYDWTQPGEIERAISELAS